MGKIEEYLEKIISIGKPEDMNEIGEIFNDMSDYICENNKELYKSIETEMYEMLYGKTLSEDIAEKWVQEMKPEPRWTKQETTQAMQQMGITCDPLEFYVVANMIYSDYDEAKDDEQLALNMAREWLADEDIKKDKLYNYAKYVARVI